MGIIEPITAVFDIEFHNLQSLIPQLLFVVVLAIIGGIALLSVSSGTLGALASSMSTSTTGSLLSLLGAIAAVGIVLVLFAIIGVLVFLVLGALVIGAYASIVKQKMTSGSFNISKAFDEARANWVRLIVVSLIVGVISIGVNVVLELIPVAGAILAIIVGLVLSILLFEANSMVIIEGKEPIAAIQRSIEIGKDNFWSMLGMLIVFGIAVGIISVVVILVFSLAGAVASAAGISGAVILGVLIVFLFIEPLGYMLPATFYYKGMNGAAGPAMPAKKKGTTAT